MGGFIKIKMEKIQVKIGWSGNNYSCVADAPVLNGIVVATGKTLEGLKKKVVESLTFHIEGCMHLHPVACKVENGHVITFNRFVPFGQVGS